MVKSDDKELNARLSLPDAVIEVMRFELSLAERVGIELNPLTVTGSVGVSDIAGDELTDELSTTDINGEVKGVMVVSDKATVGETVAVATLETGLSRPL